MTTEDGQYFDDQESAADAELELALRMLTRLSQAEVAAEIGISERRLRDIERGRSKPRPRNREAILRLAETLRAGNPPGGEQSTWQGEDSANPLGPILVGAIIVVVIIALACLWRPPADQ